MAGRIRTIKPELLTDGDSGCLSHAGWRLFVSMLLLADDHGSLPAEPAMLHGYVFWGRPLADPGDVAGLISELAQAGMVLAYTVRGARYVSIFNWRKHQKIDRPGKARYPGPADPGAKIDEGSRDPRETLATDHDHDHDHDLDRWRKEAEQIWELQEKERKAVIPGAYRLKPTAERLKRIVSLLADGTATPADCEAVIRAEADAVRRDPEQAKWFNGDTTWRRKNFDRKLANAGVARPASASMWGAISASAKKDPK